MSSSDDEENHIHYGSALEPYEEDEVPTKRKFQQPADQYAVDEHGRRRFHGAFTGGFSAGYGNTVGTQEGWAPTSFKSSRREKASFSGQRAEDFMDDEDRDEFGIAPRQLQTKSEFSGRKRAMQQRYHDGPIPGEPVLEQFLRPVHETAAVRLLRAMGWRDGRGAGDRVTRKERHRARQQHKVYGCSMPGEMRQTTETHSDSSSDSEVDFDALYQPEDYEPYILQRKNDRFGLGYKGLSRHSVLGEMRGEYGGGDGRSHLLMKDKGKRVSIRGQAFGVGAFEEDDQDIYAKEDMSHYDFELGGERETTKKPQKKQERGVNVLEGFVKASKPIAVVQSNPPPALPRDYVPKPAGFRRSRFEPCSTAQERDQGLGRHELTAEARGTLLGETAIPKPTESEPIDPIARITGRNVSFISTTQTEPSTSQQSDQNEKPALDFISIADSGKELVKVFKPFKMDPKKQARYESYLKNKDDLLNKDRGIDNLSEWERNREMAEFEQASKLYRPLTGVIADRFTHASEPDDALNPLTAVSRSSVNYGLATPEMIDAAKQGIYGVMTRKTKKWVAEALVYKRFNIPQPGMTTENNKTEKPKVSYSIFSYLESSVHDKESFAKEQTNFSGSKSLSKEHVETNTVKDTNIINRIDNNTKPPEENSTNSAGFAKRITVAELFMKESEKDIQNKSATVTDTIDKFEKMDLYKSIFLSDTEDEDVVDGGNDKSKNEDTVNEFVETPKNVERNNSPPRGIFANIDFDELNSWRRKAEEKSKKNEESTTEKANSSSKSEENPNAMETKDIYGPKIPENLQKRLESAAESNFRPIFKPRDKAIEVHSSSSSDSWVSESELKKAKKHHKKKSKKNKKHKSKHKKSKHKKKTK